MAEREKLTVDRGTGHIAIEVSGSGPLVLCVPGMGESQAAFRHLTPGLIQAGYRVATMDLRGHGDSSATFDSYDDEAAAGDVLAAIEALGQASAAVVGNSMGAAAAVIAADRDPMAVARLILIAPAVRDHSSAVGRALTRLGLMRPWGPAVWRHYYNRIFGQPRPSDHAEHVARALALLSRPGYWTAFQATTRTSHAPAEAALARVRARSLVIMGDADRDFPDPAEEAAWLAEALDCEYHVMAGAGHYPMAERPEATLALVLPFLAETDDALS
ncbi:MAG: alpha/beta hydrolase [Actinomycetaceae bacterium]|nr:alpha/beta hydrolase [Actinomycetaceae bacterium]